MREFRGRPGEVRRLPAATLSTQSVLQIETQRSATLTTLDQANMVILQMAFWFLGIGIICGAVWADHSWGRPWGWDPKETFALITWIVYLIIVHIRIVAPKVKQTTTAWLSVDESDNDPSRFWRHLVAALEPIRPGATASLSDVVSASTTPSPDIVATRLINVIAA